MGLDVVELVMRIEEEFAITIEDEEASFIETVGQLHFCVLGKLGLTAPHDCISSATFYQLRRALVSSSGSSRRSIRPSTPTELLLSSLNRRQQWRTLSDTTGAKLPALERPKWMITALRSAACLFAVSAFWLWLTAPFAPAILLTECLIFAGICKWSQLYAVQLPADCATVGGLSKTMLKLNYGMNVEKEKTWVERAVWDKLRDILVDELGAQPDAITPEAHFVRDLRLD